MGFEEIEHDDFTEMLKRSGRFASYEITLGKWKYKDRTDIEIKHREVVVASGNSVVKKYMKTLAGNKVPGKKKWRWDGNTYEQKGGSYYVFYEKLEFEPAKKILL